MPAMADDATTPKQRLSKWPGELPSTNNSRGRSHRQPCLRGSMGAHDHVHAAVQHRSRTEYPHRMGNADDGGLIDDAEIAAVEAARGGAEHEQLARAQL